MAIVPEAVQTAWTYVRLRLPVSGHPCNPLQQLVYAAVVFVLAPALIATGRRHVARCRGTVLVVHAHLRRRQVARSLHFLALVATILFAVGQIALVAIEDVPRNMAWLASGLPGFLPLRVEMEALEDVVYDRCQHHSSQHEKHPAGQQRVASGQPLACGRAQRIDRPHPTQ